MQGDVDGALAYFWESLDVTRRLLQQDADRPEWLRDLSLILARVASVLVSQKRFSEARPLFDEAMEVVRDLRERFPEQPAWYQGFPELLAKHAAEAFVQEP